MWNSHLGLCAIFVVVFAAPGGGTKYEAGLTAFRNRDFASAERLFSQILRQDSTDAHAHKLLGMCYAAEEKYEAAAGEFTLACSAPSREPDACYYLGRASLTLGRLRQAQRAFQKALETSEKAEHGRILLGMALAYEAQSDAGSAERCYREAISRGESRALIDYGLFLAKTGRAAEGLDYLRRAGATDAARRVSETWKNTPQREGDFDPMPVSFGAHPLPMTVRNGARGEKHLIETMVAGIAFFDFDHDGWPDIFVANGAAVPSLRKTDGSFANRLFRNNRDGTFSDVTDRAKLAGQGFSMGVAAGDFDNDGNIDLFITGVGSNHLYRNLGNGTFEDVSASAGVDGNHAWSVAAGWFDYDNDGLLDLFVVRYVDWSLAADVFCGSTATVAYRQYCHPRQYRPLPNLLYRNLGNGRFQDVSRESGIAALPGKGMGVVFGDLDGDGRLDIFVANDTVPNFLFHNQGDGTFRDIAMEAGVALNADGQALSSMGADFRDYDNDGREDLFVTALSNESFPLFRNTGQGRFVDVGYTTGLARSTMPWTGWSTGLSDFNNDGYKDIFVAGGHVMDNAELSSDRKSRQPNFVYLNRGGRDFEAEALPGEALHRGAAFADFNRDGRVDVVVTRLNQEPLLLMNTSARTGHWMEFLLTGRKSNRDAIGATIHITTASGEQWNRVTTSVGYGGSSDRVVHFGLGTDASLRRVDIAWPSGARQRLENVPADRLLEVSEP